MKKTKIVFSDEAGTWAEGPYYIRSWIFWDYDKYNQIEKKYISDINKVKHLIGWKNGKLKRSLSKENIEKIFNSIDQIYITFTITDEFKKKKYKIKKN